jgi:hypothetical protein
MPIVSKLIIKIVEGKSGIEGKTLGRGVNVYTPGGVS